MVKHIRQRNRFQASAVLTLALWQVRRTWFLLLVILLGTIAAVVITCTIPLLSNVMTTAGLRNTLRATPDSAHILLNTQTNGISSSIVKNVHNQFDPLLQQNIGKTLTATGSSLVCNDFSFYPEQKDAQLTVYGTSLAQAAPHLGPVQGRLAQTVAEHPDEIELMMTPDSARQLGARVGTSFKLLLNYSVILPYVGEQRHTAMVTAHVVGLFNVTATNTAYWHGEDFTPLKTALEGGTTLSRYTALVSDKALLALFDRLSAANHTDAIHTQSYSGYGLTWHYQLDSSHLASTDLDPLISRLANIQSIMDTQYGDLEHGTTTDASLYSPYLTYAEISSPVLSSSGDSTLNQLHDRITVTRIPSGVFTILIIALVLFFVSLITTLLVDRQTETIALLRSRGASQGQIFCSLLLQAAVMGIFAFFVGLLLTILAVLFLARRLLPATAMDALNTITDNPLRAVEGTSGYALAIVVITLLTMSFSLFMTTRMDVLALRRETARSNKQPFWQRFYLDVVAGVIALTSYGFLLYVTSVGAELQGNAQVLVTRPLSIIAPFFLVIGCLILFLRVFPLLLRLGTQLAARGRGVVALLALAQMARTPRQSLRMTLLLSLATAFALFTLFYTAAQDQHIQDIVSYQTGADFSIHLQPSRDMPAQVVRPYQSLPGVLAASSGYNDQGYGGTADLPMEIRAVDASNFDGATLWSSEEALQRAHPLFRKLVALRSTQITGTPVPVIVDQTLINKLRLHVGSAFTIRVTNAFPNVIHCFIIGVVDRIPTINTLFSSNSNTSAAPVTTGGVLMDYQTYFRAYQQDVKIQKTPAGELSLPTLNQVWLRTSDNPVTLTSIRSALNGPAFRFAHLTDRRLLLSTLQSDPLYLIMDGVLTIGTLTALLLALVGGLLVSWVSARARLMNVVTLRALGGTSEQVTGMFSWEQTIISLTGFVLGGGFGLLLATSVIPALTFTDLNSDLSNTQLFALQSALAAQLVVPPTLPLLVLTGIAIYIAILILMVRVVSRAGLGRTLRLNED